MGGAEVVLRVNGARQRGGTEAEPTGVRDKGERQPTLPGFGQRTPSTPMAAPMAGSYARVLAASSDRPPDTHSAAAAVTDNTPA